MTQQANTPPPPTREWFWRILAVLMLAMACWVGWVAWQIAPSTPVATPAAFQALSRARSMAPALNVQQGVIRQPAPAGEARLRMADSIQTPITEK